MYISRQLIKTSSVLFILFLALSVCTVFAMPTVYPTGTTIHDATKAYNGNVIYQSGDKVMLVDMSGATVNTWQRADRSITYVKPLNNGNVLVTATMNDRSGNITIAELDWDSNIIWEYGGHDMHHDFERLENGNTLILCTTKTLVPSISPLKVYDDYIIEVNPQGQIVWEWHSVDHFDEFELPRSYKNWVRTIGGDWAHINSIQSLPDTMLTSQAFNKGNILVSQKHTNTIYIINKNTGAIVWKAGPVDNITIGQHHATMQPAGSQFDGNILVFDNGNSGSYYSEDDYRLYSRVLVFNPVSMETVWEYTADKSSLPPNTFFSYSMSGTEMLPNGNVLITEGTGGRLFQVTSEGEIVWEYIHPYFYQVGSVLKNSVYRAYMVESSWGSN